MNSSQKIYFNSGNTGNSQDDKYVKVRLEQKVQTLEFMSLSFSTEDAYQNFNSDYGVLVGRVVANESVGIPNAKISIFIPVEENDKTDSEIYSVYPYETPRDKNNEGKRYNLLPRVSVLNEDGALSPKQAFGSFPIKPEIVVNETLLNVYKKYYKYTAVTNDSGDYMIFGVPVGTQTVHLSVDITDIGKYSMNPAAMVVNLGYSPNLFTDNNTKIKPSVNLNDLPHIETQEISVNIIPFWGDVDNFEIGITRQDFKIRAVLVNNFTVFGTVFTDGDNHMWGDNNDNNSKIRNLYYRRRADHLLMNTKRIGKITENVYYYPTNMSDADIANAYATDPEGKNMLKLDPSEYSVYKRDGDFVFIINCNRRKVITDESGTEIIVPNDSTAGVFTEFKGFVTIEITKDDLPMNFSSDIRNRPLSPIRYRIKIPQQSERHESFSMYRPSTSYNTLGVKAKTAKWRHEHFTFRAGNIYSVAKFNGTVYNSVEDDDGQGFNNGFMDGDRINDIYNLSTDWNVGLILSEIDDEGNDGIPVKVKELPDNAIASNNRKAFGANWLNFAIHLPQIGYLNPTVESGQLMSTKSSSNFTQDFRRSANTAFPSKKNYYWGNEQPIVANEINTRGFARSDLHWTAFIEIPKDVLQGIKEETDGIKGFKYGELSIPLRTKIDAMTTNKFRNGQTGCPINGGKQNGDPNAGTDTNIYFYKGWDAADCIEFLFSLNVV